MTIPSDNNAEFRDSGVYTFGDWTLNYLSNQLIRDGEALSLEHRHAALLRLLVSSNNQVVLRDEIFRVVWQRKVVNDESLAVAISQLRKLLNDDARAPRYIKTIPSVGYQFIAPVTAIPSSIQTVPLNPPRRFNRYYAMAVAVLLIVAAPMMWNLRQHTPLADSNTPGVSQLVKAKALLNSNDESRWREAVGEFRQILAGDATNANAWLGLAEAKMRLLGDRQIQDDNYQELKTLLQKALSIDPSLARAHLWMAHLLIWHDRNFKDGQHYFETALKLDSSDELIQLHYAHFLMVQKRFDEAREQIGTVRNLDPLQFSHTQMVWVHMLEGDYAAAAAELDRIAATEVAGEEFHRAALNLYSHLGDEQRTYAHMQWFFQYAKLEQYKIDALNQRFEQSGLKGVYQWLLDNKETADLGQFTPPLSWARYAVAVNQKDTAISFLKLAFDQRHPHTQCVAADPMYQPLYNDKRFKQLIESQPLSHDVSALQRTADTPVSVAVNKKGARGAF